jgi:hypothetical protein
MFDGKLKQAMEGGNDGKGKWEIVGWTKAGRCS